MRVACGVWRVACGVCMCMCMCILQCAWRVRGVCVACAWRVACGVCLRGGGTRLQLCTHGLLAGDLDAEIAAHRLHTVAALGREEAGREGAPATGLHLTQVGDLGRVRVRVRVRARVGVRVRVRVRARVRVPSGAAGGRPKASSFCTTSTLLTYYDTTL